MEGENEVQGGVVGGAAVEGEEEGEGGREDGGEIVGGG